MGISESARSTISRNVSRCSHSAEVINNLAALQLNDALFATIEATLRAWNHSSSLEYA